MVLGDLGVGNGTMQSVLSEDSAFCGISNQFVVISCSVIWERPANHPQKIGNSQLSSSIKRMRI